MVDYSFLDNLMIGKQEPTLLALFDSNCKEKDCV